MAGKILADDIQHSTAGTVGTEYVVGGTAKVWCHFNGRNTPSIQDSLNASSLTDRGTGQYTLNFSTSMANANHASTGAVKKDDTNDDGNLMIQLGGHASYTTVAGELRIMVKRISSSASVVDTDEVYTVTHGDLA
jgi:hypothetical protein